MAFDEAAVEKAVSDVITHCLDHRGVGLTTLQVYSDHFVALAAALLKVVEETAALRKDVSNLQSRVQLLEERMELVNKKVKAF